MIDPIVASPSLAEILVYLLTVIYSAEKGPALLRRLRNGKPSNGDYEKRITLLEHHAKSLDNNVEHIRDHLKEHRQTLGELAIEVGRLEGRIGS